VQYGEFWSGLIHGDFGTSLVYRAPALGVVLARVPATVELALCAMGLSIVLGLMVGVLSAAQPNGLFGRAADFLAVAGRATPPFVFGILLIILLAIELRLLPSGGSGAGSTLVMPAATLAFATLPTIVRITRTGMIDALRNDYVRTARAKGLSTGAVLWRHALRNAALPIVTIIGIEFGSLLGGVAVVETLFAWPGLGYLAITALSQRDYPVIQAVLLVGAFWFVVANTVVDFAYTVLDPRTRTG
jgi:peptide/nickel transport system permease protein